MIFYSSLDTNYCIAKQCIDINPWRDFRYVLKDSICCKQLDMSLSRRDLYHIEFWVKRKIYRFYEVKISSKLLVCISKKLFASKPYASQLHCIAMHRYEFWRILDMSCRLDMCFALDMLPCGNENSYHIEFEHSENISIYEVKYRANFSLHIDKKVCI